MIILFPGPVISIPPIDYYQQLSENITYLRGDEDELSFRTSLSTIKLPSAHILSRTHTSIPAATLLLAVSRKTSHSSRHLIGLLDNFHMASNKLTVVNDRSPPDIVFGVLYCLGPTCVCPVESA